MPKNIDKAVLWTVFTLLFVLTPLVLMLVGEMPEGRGFWVDFGVFLGFIGLSAMCLQFLLTGRFPRIGKPFGVDTLLQYHKHLGIAGFALVLGHVIVVTAANPDYLSFFDPRVNFPRAISLIAVLIALAGIISTSLWRTKFRLNYEWWRLVHAGLAAMIVLIGLAHLIMVGHFTGPFWKAGVWVVVCVVAAGWLAQVRLIEPFKARRRPWRVAEVRPEGKEIWTLALEPDGHDGFHFKAGQYAWISIGQTPFQLQQHPFTIASSAAHPKRVEFAIKELGDFTSNLKNLPSGTRAFLEGPYGHFHLRVKTAPVSVFLAGGIGVSPALGFIRWLNDTHSKHPFRLFYAAETVEDLAYRDELGSHKERLDLEVIYVVESPPDNWNGEKGLITTEVLQRHLPKDRLQTYDYLICGPDVMAKAVHKCLGELNVPPHHQRDELFNMV